MAQYEVPTPSTLLLRMVRPEQAAAALRMLHESDPASEVPAVGFRVATLSDVSSDPSVAPLAACVVHHQPNDPTAWLGRFAVSVPFRRRGLGRRLLAELSRVLQAEGAQRLWVHLGADQPAVRALLAGAGFVVCQVEPTAVFPAGLAASEDDPEAGWWVREL
ncbi:GNAT family N-acetyltransferase [Micromonospora sp. NPDC047738]|uniref:GNAT family N-acetyltransferase n=1 Tax=unclassified Micromonospora TaxID=2617518 RepID=UPI00340734E6